MKLLGITPGDDRDLTPWLEALGRGGLKQLLIREPQRSASELSKVIEEASRWIRTVIVHERCNQAEAMAADHGLLMHRRLWSCHSADELDDAFEQGAPYCLLSAVWRPTSKPDDTRKPLGLAKFERLAAGRAVYALGGVLPGHLPVLRQQNVHGIAVLGGLFGAQNPAAAKDRLKAFL